MKSKIINIQIRDNKIIPQDDPEQMTFSELKLNERDLESFFCENPQYLIGDSEEEDILIVGRQTKDTDGKISDLIALDEKGRLILIELKRDEKDIKGRREELEFQAIRYVSELASIRTVEQLAETIYSKYLEKYEKDKITKGITSVEEAKIRLNKFLTETRSQELFNKSQRIILASSGFDNITLSACAWLVDNNVDITVFVTTPIKNPNGELQLKVDRILPLDDNSKFFGKLKYDTKTKKITSETTISRSTLPTMKHLIYWGIVKVGEKLEVSGYELDNKWIEIKDQKNGITWDGRQLSYTQWGKEITQTQAFGVYDRTHVQGNKETLSEARAKYMKENNITDW
ncbi:MAG: hypothetical protein ACOX8T_09085 [Bacillota bacterium]|jgi:hypothetical protein